MHRDSQKRIYGDYTYFITCDVKNKIAFFKENILCEFWREELRLAKEMKQFSLFAFCLNYDHFHLLIKPKNIIANYSQIMHFIKRHSSRNINIILGYNKIDLEKMINSTENDIGIPSSEGDVRISSTENDVRIPSTEGDVGQRRLRWMEFDKITYKYRKKFIEKFGNNFPYPKFKWQTSFYDHVIRNKNDFNNHWNYTMYNFLKHKLPENWKYTGLKHSEIIDKIDIL